MSEIVSKKSEMFEQTLRNPNSDYFKKFLEGTKEYRGAIEPQENRHTYALLMALVLNNQKMINELMKRVQN